MAKVKQYYTDLTEKQVDDIILSYKWLNRKGERYGRDRMTYEKDPNAKVCVFHGYPNPAESDQDWVKKLWN